MSQNPPGHLQQQHQPQLHPPHQPHVPSNASFPAMGLPPGFQAPPQTGRPVLQVAPPPGAPFPPPPRQYGQPQQPQQHQQPPPQHQQQQQHHQQQPGPALLMNPPPQQPMSLPPGFVPPPSAGPPPPAFQGAPPPPHQHQFQRPNQPFQAPQFAHHHQAPLVHPFDRQRQGGRGGRGGWRGGRGRGRGGPAAGGRNLTSPYEQYGAWLAYTDEDDGAEYFYNVETHQSTWKRPDAVPVPPELRGRALPVSGTPWSEVRRPGEPVYFYNSKTRQSQWQIPEAIASVFAQREEARAQKKAQQQQLADLEAARLIEEAMGFDDFFDHLSEDEEEENQEQAQQRANKEKEIEKENEKIAQFKQLLQEVAIRPFSAYETELDKFKSDARFVNLQNEREKKRIFESHVASLNSAENEKNEEMTEKMGKLMHEYGITAHTSWQDVKKALKKSEEYKFLGEKKTEKIFRELSAPIRAQRKVEKEKMQKNLREFLSLNESKILKEKRVDWDFVRNKFFDHELIQTDKLRNSEKKEIFNVWLKERKSAGDKKRLLEGVETTEKKRKYEIDRVREKQNEINFDLVLQERINLLHINLSYEEAVNQAGLKNDERFNSSKLSKQQKLYLFQKRIDELYQVLYREFVSIVSERESRIALNAEWSEINVLFPQLVEKEEEEKERKKESEGESKGESKFRALHQKWFKVWQNKREEKAWKDFEALLKSMAQTFARTPQPPFENEEDKVHYESSMNLLLSHKSWLALEDLDTQRQKKFDDWWRELKRKVEEEAQKTAKRPTRENVKDVSEKAPDMVIKGTATDMSESERFKSYEAWRTDKRRLENQTL